MPVETAAELPLPDSQTLKTMTPKRPSRRPSQEFERGFSDKRLIKVVQENERDQEQRPLGSSRRNKMEVTIMTKDNQMAVAEFYKDGVTEEKDEVKSQRDDSPVLLQQKTETTSNNVLLYNVYYNKNERQEGSPIKDIMKSMAKKAEEIPGLANNIVKVEVDINELKKYAPLVSPSNSKDYQNLANEITKSIQVTQDGEIQVNSMKINPNAIKLQQRDLNMHKFDAQKGTNEQNDKKKVLFKTTKLYRDKKYLLIITHIERVSDLNKLISAHEGDEQVYEEFDILFEISAYCLSDNVSATAKKFEQTIPYHDCVKYSGQQLAPKIAKYFIDNIHIYGEIMILSCPYKIFSSKQSFLIMYEGAIKSIQRKFRMKKFRLGFTKFRNTLKDYKEHILGRGAVSINGILYHSIIVVYPDKKDRVSIQCWEAEDFIKYELFLALNNKLEPYLMDKHRQSKTVELLISFLGMDQSKDGQVLVLKEKFFFESLMKEFPS